jgi:hypothetical protein
MKTYRGAREDSLDTILRDRKHALGEVGRRRGNQQFQVDMYTTLTFFFLAIGFFTALGPFSSAEAQGWWWGSPVDPSFDRSKVVQLTGTASQVAIRSSVGPSMLRLNTAEESLTVILGPSWYLFEMGADVRNGDTLTVEGAKMKDRQGQVYLVASHLTNHRTNKTLELRDEAGWPRWKGKPSKAG